MITMSPLPCRIRQTSSICKVPDWVSSDPTKATPGGSCLSAGSRFTYTSGMRAATARRVILGVDGIDDDRIHLLRNEILHLVELPADIVLGVFELDVDIELLRPRLHAGAHDGEEVVIEQRHGNADRGGLRGSTEQRQRAGEERERDASHATKCKRRTVVMP